MSHTGDWTHLPRLRIPTGKRRVFTGVTLPTRSSICLRERTHTYLVHEFGTVEDSYRDVDGPISRDQRTSVQNRSVHSRRQ